nr:hypothetical protein [Tanacetum cinerariifolium]
AKRTAWTEFSSSMASTIICLATSRKLNFFKYIFDSMVRNVDSPINAARNFITAVRYELMLFGLMKVDVVNLMLLEAIIRRDLRLDDADGVECLPNAEIVKELARMGYEKPPPKLTFYKAFFSVFANMRRVGKGFLGVENPLFDSMMVQSQQEAKENVEVPIPHTQPSTTREKIAVIDADEGITLVDVETNEEEVTLDAESQGRINLNASSKGVSAISAPELFSTVEPTVFDDEDVTMTLAQTLIKL